MKFSIKLLALAASMAVAGAASAQSAGQYMVKLGINKLTPHVDSGDISAPALPGSKGAVSSDTEPVLVGDYGVTDNISVETAIGLPYKSDLSGAGSIAGIGKLGTVKALPATVFVQYRFFEPKAAWRPYVGLGATYAYFYNATGSGAMTSITNIGSSTPTTFKIDNKLTYSAQVGVAYNFSERWYADLTYIKTKLKTHVTFSSGQHQDMTLDPSAVMFGIGYKF